MNAMTFEEVMEDIGSIATMLDSVMRKGVSDYGTYEVMAMLLEGRLLAWKLEQSVVLTQDAEIGGKRCLVLAYAGGSLVTLKRILAELEARANALGYHELRILGRRGWLKVLPGFEEVHTVIRKPLYAVN